ncbi:uncharacterized protein cubi_03097 [Cryptosporidium ubiquitum]|uniref:Uncharacterized protein n=1 Tax=Cryptosporidium ubiquitum TaxID=857276 RepID=A0A1J4MNF9_9CRYT|nr:uncharacterized protein cubi_03097 [Cryptosporidium ubiquitum]OII74987.1 hypothetical protein cubi_03097 [Cryptosporidium ubiquitum]
MNNNDNLNIQVCEDGDVLSDILVALENGDIRNSNNQKEVLKTNNRNKYVNRSAPYLSNPFFHELMRGKENKLSDLDREIPTHLLARIAQKRESAPELWKKLWSEKKISDVIRNFGEEEISTMEKIFVSCVVGEETTIVSPEKYFSVSDWSYYIWWLFSRRPEISKISPKLPGHVVTAVASMEWRLLPKVRPDILSAFISKVNTYKSSNPLPKANDKSIAQRDYFKKIMNELRSGLENNFSEWLLPFLRSKKIQIEGFGQNSTKTGSSNSIKGSELIKESMPVEKIPKLICRDIDRSLVKKKGHANLVPTHLFPHFNSSDCCLQNQIYQNVYIEEYSNLSWSVLNTLPKIDIKVGIRVQFVYKPEGFIDELYWINGEIESISAETGEIILKSSSSKEDSASVSISTSLLNFLPPSIPTFEIKKDWWRLLLPESTSNDISKGSIVVYKSNGSEQKLLDGVLVEINNDDTGRIIVKRLFDGKCEEIDTEAILNRIPYDIHPFDGKYDKESSLSSWTWCIPRPFQGENSKGSKGKLLLWFVSGEINMINDDPLLCVSIQPDIPFNHGYIWGPLPITCFIDVKTPIGGNIEQGCSFQDIDSILDTPLSLLV